MEFIVSDKINPKDCIEIRESIGWNRITEDQMERAIKNSMFNVSIFDKDLCVGMGRIVGDNVLKGMLTDIMVRKEYHGMGVGKLIVKTLMDKLEQSVKEGDSFQLEASPTANNRDFYIKCGLKYKPENQDGVYIWIRK